MLQQRGLLHLPVQTGLLRRRLPLHPRYPRSNLLSAAAGLKGGLKVVPVSPERTKTRCETHRESLLAVTEFGPRGPRPPVGQYIPVCDESGAYEPMQCHGSTGYCWCVDRNGQEISGSRSEPGSRPMCEETTGFSGCSVAPRHASRLK